MRPEHKWKKNTNRAELTCFSSSRLLLDFFSLARPSFMQRLSLSNIYAEPASLNVKRESEMDDVITHGNSRAWIVFAMYACVCLGTTICDAADQIVECSPIDSRASCQG